LLGALPAPLQPLDVSALDGYLCGVLLQPKRVPAERWLPLVTDLEGRPAPQGPALQELHALVQRRYTELDRPSPSATGLTPGSTSWMTTPMPSECLLPWVAGFAAAMEAFPALMALSDPELVEPLALLFMHFDPDDLEDADALVAVIETLEPPADLGEAVQDTVRALMLIADVSRPRAAPPRTCAWWPHTGGASGRPAASGQTPR
jgi:uncharacterized protein